MENAITEYIAKSTMELKDVNSCLSFVSTVWREKPILVVYDNLNGKIVSTWFDPVLQDGDISILENLVLDFLN